MLDYNETPKNMLKVRKAIAFIGLFFYIFLCSKDNIKNNNWYFTTYQPRTINVKSISDFWK